jgi:hypothetical protein
MVVGVAPSEGTLSDDEPQAARSRPIAIDKIKITVFFLIVFLIIQQIGW